MKTAFVWISLALLAGYFVGGLVPRRERDRMRAELEAARKTAAQPAESADAVSAVERLVKLDPADPPPAADDRDRRAPPAPPPPPAPATTAAAPAPERRGPTPEEFRERIQRAADAWRLRSEVIRAGFLDKTGFDEAQTAQFDLLTAAMNVRLRSEIEKLAARLQSDTPVTPEDSARFMQNLSSIMVLTYDEMDRTLTPAWREKAGQDFDTMDFVDPAVAEPLIEVAPKLERMRAGRMERGRQRVFPFTP